MKVAQRAPDAAMTQKPLDGVEIDAVLQRMGSEGMAQAVDAALLGDAALGLGGMRDTACGLAGDWPHR